MISMLYFGFIFYLTTLDRFTLGDSKNTSIYWNAPTDLCHQHGISFESLVNNGIQVNKGDAFQGDKIVIFYFAGLFPRIRKNKNNTFYCLNHCVPQEGNLTSHLEKFYRDIEEKIPDKNFNGLAVIDFEDWEPLFILNNWSYKKLHVDYSINVEKKRHPEATKEHLISMAQKRFDKFARIFFESTLLLGQKYRPRGKWGYYGFPKCLNMLDNDQTYCSKNMQNSNDKMMWLYEASNALYPSIYFRNKHSKGKRNYGQRLIEGRLKETQRLLKKSQRKLEVYPYFSTKYVDNWVDLPNNVLRDALKKIKEMNIVDGVILWSKETYVDNKNKCKSLFNYAFKTLVPAMIELWYK